jgi:transcriptional regulator with XRE-family HTH domain
MEIYERLEAIMNYEKIDRQNFTRLTGISNSTLTQAKQGAKVNFRLENYEKILEQFPSLNRDWLIWGEGEMYRQISNPQQPSLFDSDEVTESKSPTYGQENSNENTTIPVQKTEQSPIAALPAIVEPKPLQKTEPVVENLPAPPTPPAAAAPAIAKPASIELVEIPPKTVKKIILYYSDNTFQEFV